MSKTMLAAVLHGIQDLRVDERAVPELEPGKALVRVRRGGTCGSDVHCFEEGRFGRFAVTAPFFLGHEVAGEVVAVTDGVSPTRRGPACGGQSLTAVRALPLLACAKTGVVKVQIDLT